jgi:hypothetical protein
MPGLTGVWASAAVAEPKISAARSIDARIIFRLQQRANTSERAHEEEAIAEPSLIDHPLGAA